MGRGSGVVQRQVRNSREGEMHAGLRTHGLCVAPCSLTAPLSARTSLPLLKRAVKVATFLTMPPSHPLVTTNRAQQEEHMQVRRRGGVCVGRGGARQARAAAACLLLAVRLRPALPAQSDHPYLVLPRLAGGAGGLPGQRGRFGCCGGHAGGAAEPPPTHERAGHGAGAAGDHLPQV